MVLLVLLFLCCCFCCFAAAFAASASVPLFLLLSLQYCCFCCFCVFVFVFAAFDAAVLLLLLFLPLLLRSLLLYLLLFFATKMCMHRTGARDMPERDRETERERGRDEGQKLDCVFRRVLFRGGSRPVFSSFLDCFAARICLHKRAACDTPAKERARRRLKIQFCLPSRSFLAARDLDFSIFSVVGRL